jgi:hypothetical protein
MHTFVRDAEPGAKPIHHRGERRDIGSVAGPELAADGPPLAVEHRPDDHLFEVRTVVLAMTAPAEGIPAFTFEVDGGRVEEDQLELGEQVTPPSEERLLDEVLGAAGCERCPVGLLLLGQLVAEPTHRPIQMMELEIVASVDLIVSPPLLGGAVAAGVEEPVQDSEEDGSLDGELEAPTFQQLPDDVPAAGELPEPLEDQGRADVPDRDGRQLALGVLGDQQDGTRQAGPGGEQRVELAALLKLIEPPEGGDDALP